MYSDTDVDVEKNRATNFMGLEYNDQLTFKNNDATSDYIYSDFHADVESNDADYRLAITYANYGPRWDEVSDYGMGAWDMAPVKGTCANFSASSADSTTSLPATPCPVTLPPGAMLTAGTTKVPGAECTGDTVIQLVNATSGDDLVAPHTLDDDTDTATPDFTPGHDNTVYNDDYGNSGCSLVQYINGGTTALSVNIMANCHGDPENDCSGTVAYVVQGLKTTVVKKNTADYIYMGAFSLRRRSVRRCAAHVESCKDIHYASFSGWDDARYSLACAQTTSLAPISKTTTRTMAWRSQTPLTC
jgi:hypothetical protein